MTIQPKTDTAALSLAIQEFEDALPGWRFIGCPKWVTIFPLPGAVDSDLLTCKIFDQFRIDIHNPEIQMADALREVMLDALEAREIAKGKLPKHCPHAECAKCPLTVE